jgi:hypothetical protein
MALPFEQVDEKITNKKVNNLNANQKAEARIKERETEKGIKIK